MSKSLLGVYEECHNLTAGRREAPKALRDFGQPRAQLCWALGYNENNIFVGLAAARNYK